MIKKPTLFLMAVSVYWLMPSPAMAQSEKPQVQLIQTATGVTYQDGVLTLKNVSPVTTFFSDRPKRITGHVRNDQFVKLWNEGKNSFKNDPPNAALSVFDPTGRPTQTIVMLTNPRVDGTNISYNAKPLKGDLPAQGASASLFIDGVGAPCGEDVNYSGEPCWAQEAFTRKGW